MKIPYKSLNPQAGVVNYEITGHSMVVEFAGGKYRYVYNSDSPGIVHMMAMKRLAAQGKGLTTYISQHVGKNYARRLPLEP